MTEEIKELVKVFDTINTHKEDAKAEVLAEIASILRELVIGIKTECGKIDENLITNEKVIVCMKEQNDKFLEILKYVQNKFEFIPDLKESAFFDYCVSIGGTFKTMVDMYNIYYADNSMPSDEKEIN